MSLDQGIRHGKEKRKQYYGAKAIDKTCRNHGSCDWCRQNKLYRTNREEEKMILDLRDYQLEESEAANLMDELQEKLRKLEARQFMHEMKDCWDAADYSYARTLKLEIEATKENIQALKAHMN